MGAHSQGPSEARHERGKPKAIPLEEIAIVKRLIDEECAPGSREGLLAELVRATSANEPAPINRARVSARVRGLALRAPGLTARVGATVVLLGGAAAAAAALEHSVGLRAHTPAASMVPSPVVVAPLAAAPSAVEVQAPPAPMVSTDSPSVRVKAVARPMPVPGGGASFRDGEDPAPVLEAIRALRSENDAARAGVLLADYLRAHPRSVLSEDALALSIESALARSDGRAAGELSRRYLAQFPGGRYRAFALRATAP
jgi:hypothetical protein